MKNEDSQPASLQGRSTLRIAVTATFTADPVAESLAFWMEELRYPASIEFAPYSQVFQQLLDPGSLLARNREGVNIILVRLEDWQRFDAGSPSREALAESLERNAADLVDAVRIAITRSASRLILAFCPNSTEATADKERQDQFAQIEGWVASELDGVGSLYLIGPDDFRDYPVEVYHDPERDRLGHIPYTPLFYVALGTILARRIRALTSPPHKVVVLDCDNTLWKGVVGEDGVEGIAIPPAWQRLQEFLVRLASKGFALCLCSKNEDADVLRVFEQREEMALKRNHLAAWRINWSSKSENIRSLAWELNLGLDSFIFLDDNPVECAEVRAGCPEVLTLRLPVEGDMVRFLKHVWAFDRLKVTAEDRSRTSMYQQEQERARFQQQTVTIQEFLAGLDLQVEISEPVQAQFSRIAQLTQRTNQFNVTTVRRSESEIQHLGDSDLECRVIEVRDRFGDYGLVGVMIFRARGDALEVDTFLLSCRVLGRGVEHWMLNELGEIARRRRLPWVETTVIPTSKNQPARDFLASVAAAFREDCGERLLYRIPAETAVNVTYDPEAVSSEIKLVTDPPVPSPGSLAHPTGALLLLERIAAELYLPEQVLETMQSRGRRRRGSTGQDHPFVAPRTKTEAELTNLWVSLLRLDRVGIHDNFFNLGGSSLLAVDLFAQIERRLGCKLPLTALIEAPTVEQLTLLLTNSSGAERDSLVLIRDGGDKPPLFLIHDGYGEIMLYRNLAFLLKPDHAVFGLQPCAQRNVPIAHTRIPEMAAYHIDKIRSVQPRGPYLLGGMCAGGVIAYEVARQLQSQEEKVAMVALLDAADVVASPRTWRFASQRIHSFSAVFQRDDSIRFNQFVLAALTKALRKAKNVTAYLIRQRFGDLRDEIRLRLLRYYLDRGLHPPRYLEQIPVQTVYLFTAKGYQPDGMFEGELALFRASHGEGIDEPFVMRYNDPLLGWGRRATQGVRVLDVPGGHSSMLQEPNVRELAKQMQLYIDGALTGEPAALVSCAMAVNDRIGQNEQWTEQRIISRTCPE